MKRMTKEEQAAILKGAIYGTVPSPGKLGMKGLTKAAKALKDKYDDLQAQIRGGQNKGAEHQREMARKLREEASRRQMQDR